MPEDFRNALRSQHSNDGHRLRYVEFLRYVDGADIEFDADWTVPRLDAALDAVDDHAE